VHRQWSLPLDPECEVVAAYLSGADEASWAAFERRHSAECERCKLYGLENTAMDGTPLGFTVLLTRSAVAAWRSRLLDGTQSEADSTSRKPA